MERKGHMVGVVVSWDPELQAPPEWVDKVYFNSKVNTQSSSAAVYNAALPQRLCLETLQTETVFVCVQDTKAEKTPHYKVLFSGPAPSSLMVAYLPQTQLERVTGIRVSILNQKCTQL